MTGGRILDGGCKYFGSLVFILMIKKSEKIIKNWINWTGFHCPLSKNSLLLELNFKFQFLGCLTLQDSYSTAKRSSLPVNVDILV